jgi:hypothetical protein
MKIKYKCNYPHIQGLFAKFVDWWQCATVLQREAVTVMLVLVVGVNVVVA